MPVKIQKGSKIAYPMQFCPVIRQITLIKRKWMLPLLLELFTTKDKIHFSTLQRALHPITPKLLTQRLRDLEKNGFVSKTRASSSDVEYFLTKKSDSLRGLVAFLKQDCIKNSASAAEQCSSCAEKHRCILAYGK